MAFVTTIETEFSIEKSKPAAVFLVFAVCTAAVASHHAPSFDEAQAWLLSRDAPLWKLLSQDLHGEGTPGLWHCLLWVLQSLGLSFRELWLASVVLAWIGAASVLMLAPFPLWLRTATVFSYFFGYQYAVVARGYAWALALAPLAAHLFQRRVRHSILYCFILGLLANSSAHGFVFASVLFLEWIIAVASVDAVETQASAGASCIFLAFAAAATMQAWPASDGDFRQAVMPLGRFQGSFLLADAFVDRLSVLAPGWERGGPFLETLLTLMLLTPSFIFLRRVRLFCLFSSLVLCNILFSSLVYSSIWHAGFIWLAWLFCMWAGWSVAPPLAWKTDQRLFVSIAVLSLFSSVDLVAAWTREMRAHYSAAPAAAFDIAYYRDSHPHAKIAAMGFKTFGVQPWFARNVFANYRGGARAPAYFSWTGGNSVEKLPSLSAWNNLLDDADYDAALLSPYGGESMASADDYMAAAAFHGFCLLAHERGASIWRAGYLHADDLLFFSRDFDACASSTP